MRGLTMTPASAASLLLNMEGLLTSMLAWFVFKENFDRRIFIGMLLIVSAGALLSWDQVPSLPAGVVNINRARPAAAVDPSTAINRFGIQSLLRNTMMVLMTLHGVGAMIRKLSVEPLMQGSHDHGV
jgi:drug/metabolite transporter (DMT)-like permease